MRQVLLVDLRDHLGFAVGCQHHQLLAGLRHISRLDVATDQDSVDGCVDDRLVEPRLRHRDVRIRLLQCGLREQVVAAGGTVGLDLQPCGAQLTVRDVEVALGIVEGGLADESLGQQVLRTVVLLAGQHEVGLSLHESLLGCGQRDFTELPDLRLGLCHCGLRLRQCGSGVFVVKHDEYVAALDALTFVDRNASDGGGDDRSDGNPLRRDDPSAGNHRLHQIGAGDPVRVDRRPEDLATEEECGERKQRGRDRGTARHCAAQPGHGSGKGLPATWHEIRHRRLRPPRPGGGSPLWAAGALRPLISDKAARRNRRGGA